jgi:LuxR family maltose regulon positive regulatory protein
VHTSDTIDLLERSAIGYLRSEDPSSAAAAIARVWPEVAATDGGRLRALIERLPDEQWSSDPWMLAAMGASHRSIDSPSRSVALPYFHTAAALLEMDPDASVALTARVHLHHAAALRSLGRFDDALALADSAAVLLDRDVRLSPLLRLRVQAQAALQRGLCLLHLGEDEAARAQLRLAWGLRENLSVSESVECLAGFSFLKYIGGEFSGALDYATKARIASGRTGLLESRFGAAALVAETLVAVERNRLDDALELAPRLGAAARRSDWEALALYAQAAISIISGRQIEGLELIRRSFDVSRSWQGDLMVHRMRDGLRGVLFLQLGELDTANRIFSAIEPASTHANCPARFIAGLRFAGGDRIGALEAIEGCEELGEMHSGRTMLDVLLIKAAANYELNRGVVADVALDRAMLFAAQTGIRTPFLLVPAAKLQQMLGRASDRNQPAQVHKLLDELRGGQGDRSQGPFEPLSDRELDVAQQLALDKTIGQIAAELFISTNTVKTHVRSIYRKLSTSTRKEAMRRIRELGLNLEITRY